jgi:hypothetical protein
MNPLELFGIGLAAGSLGALLGIGGGAILVPGLTLVAGLPLRSAVGASLVCVVATSVSGSAVYLWKDRVDLDVAVHLQAFTVVGAVAAGLVAASVPPGPLFIAFATLLAVIAIRMSPWSRGAADRAVLRPPRRRLAAGASVGAGVISGLLGVGGGVFNVPVLHLLLGMPFKRAVPTSVLMLGVTAAAAAAVYLVRGDVDTHVAGVAMLGTLGGGTLAAAVGGRINQRTLQALFTVVLLYTAWRMGLRGLDEF